MSAEDFPRNRVVENMIEDMANLSVAPTVSLITRVAYRPKLLSNV